MQDRKQGIGGSDIPVILGLSPFKTAYQLYLEKRGESDEESRTQEQKNILESGKRLEPMIVDIFEELENTKIERKQEILKYKEHDFLWGTIDGIANGNIVEIKTTSSLNKSWWSGVPPHVLAQGLYYSHLANAAGFKIVTYFRDTGVLRTFGFNRNSELEQEIIAKAVKFWEGVQSGNEPPATCYSEMQHKFKKVTEAKKAVATTTDIQIAREFFEINRQLKELEDKKEQLKIKLCEQMKDAPFLVDQEGRTIALWTARNSCRISTDDLREKYIDIYNQCKRVTTVRNFMVKSDYFNNMN